MTVGGLLIHVLFQNGLRFIQFVTTVINLSAQDGGIRYSSAIRKLRLKGVQLFDGFHKFVLASQNKFVEAIEQLDTLQAQFPNSTAVADSAVLRGQIYHCCNELDKAQAVLKEYVNK